MSGAASARPQRNGPSDGQVSPGRPPGAIVMGVLNVTPDSFSDGGRFADVDSAVAHGQRMWNDGAGLVDVGGESTRPGAARTGAAIESARILPVIRVLVQAGIAISVDTTRARVAAAALEAGATVVNDVSGGLADTEMARVVADAGCPWVLMHSRGPSRTMQERADYADVVRDVCAELRLRVDSAVAAGVDPGKIIVDPGLGFAKRPEHNWQLCAHLDKIIALGFPVLVGPSRKSYLGLLLAGRDAAPRPVDGRDAASVAVSLLAVAAGAWGVRVHDVLATVDAIKVLDAMRSHQ